MPSFYRLADLNDLDSAFEAIEDSRLVLKKQGNGQWQDGYPSQLDILNDIKNHHLYVLHEIDNPNKIIGVCALTYDEEDYHHLYEGKWLTDLPYIVMHRLALKKEYAHQGYGKKIFEIFIDVAKKEGFHSLRIDTHEGNMVMRHLIEINGFRYCGKVLLKGNKDRMVYEKII